MLQPNFIIPFDGNHADVPSGFTRDTRFDNKFIKGAASGFGDTGGAATHTHSAAHTHNLTAHTHNAANNSGNATDGNTQGAGSNGSMTPQDHNHPATTGTSSAGTTASTTISFAASNSEPNHYKVIFIKSSGWNLIPTNGMVFRRTSRTGLTFHTASDGKFLKGADTAGNAGTTVTNATHLHTQSHTHTANAHSHATGALTNANGGRAGEGGSSYPKTAQGGHTHSYDVNTSTQNVATNTDSSSATSTEPYNKTLGHYKADAQTIVGVGDIVLTTETTSFVGWNTCDGNNDTPNLTDFFIKNHSTADTTAGSNTHTHTLAHVHSGSGTHYHTAITPSGYGGDDEPRNGSGTGVRERHRHSTSDTASATIGYDSTSVTTDTVDNQPPYIKVRFIQATSSALTSGGGSFLFSLIDNTNSPTFTYE